MSFFSAFFLLFLFSLHDALPTVKRLSHVKEAIKMGLLPKHFADYHVASSNSNHPTGYIVAQEYLTINSCSSVNPDIYYGMGTGVCLIGVNKMGEYVGSSILTLDILTSAFLQFNSTVFTTLDCSGTPQSNTVNSAPLSCIPADAPSTASFKYIFTMDMNPWKSYAPGYIMELYDTKDHCTGTAPAPNFVSYSFNSCLPSTLDDGTAGGVVFMDCSQTQVAIAQFLDPTCSVVQSQITTLSAVCAANKDDNSALATNNYASGVCGKSV